MGSARGFGQRCEVWALKTDPLLPKHAPPPHDLNPSQLQPKLGRDGGWGSEQEKGQEASGSGAGAVGGSPPTCVEPEGETQGAGGMGRRGVEGPSLCGLP